MKIFSRFSQEIKNASYELRARFSGVPARIEYEVPYVGQFATPEHAESSLKKRLRPIDDPYWRETGARSAERYAEWAFTMCGMACAAMAIAHFRKKATRPAELAEDALIHRVYAESSGGISDMRYTEFAKWIRAYGLDAHVYSRLSIAGIRYALSSGNLAIVSVNPNIRGYDTALLNQRGGHLVLVTGYDMERGTLTINNPSGFVSLRTHRRHVLPLKEFVKHYAGRGIVVSHVSEEPIRLEAYDPSWPVKFSGEKKLVERALGSWIYGGVEHVGSTSVAGLNAKPTIDIMVGVKDLQESRACIPIVESLGYVYSHYKAEIMHWFCKPSFAQRDFHLYLMEYGSLEWEKRINFRDVLRMQPKVAEEYVVLKTELARKFRNNREAYTEGKAAFIEKVLRM